MFLQGLPAKAVAVLKTSNIAYSCGAVAESHRFPERLRRVGSDNKKGICTAAIFAERMQGIGPALPRGR